MFLLFFFLMIEATQIKIIHYADHAWQYTAMRTEQSHHKHIEQPRSAELRGELLG